MARLPGTGPSIDRQAEGQTVLGRAASAADFGSGDGDIAMGTVLRQTGNAVADAGQALYFQEMDSRVSGGLARAQTELDDLYFKVQADPDHNKRLETWRTESEKIKGNIRQGIGSRRYQEKFDARLFGQLESKRVDLKAGVMKAQIESSVASEAALIDAYMTSATNESDPVKRQDYVNKALARVTAMKDAGLIGELKAHDWSAKILDDSEKEELIYKAQLIADEINERYPGTDAESMAARQRAIASHDGKIRPLLRAQVEHVAAQNERIENKAQEARFAKFYTQAALGVDDPGRLTMPQLVAENLRNPFPQQYFASLLNVVGAYDKAIAEGKEDPHYEGENVLATEIKALFKTNREAANLITREQLAGRMSPTKIEEIMAMKSNPVQAGARGDYSVYSKAKAAHLFPKADDDPDQYAKKDAFISVLDEQKTAFEALHGRAQLDREMRTMVDTYASSVVLDKPEPFGGLLFYSADETAYVFELEGELKGSDLVLTDEQEETMRAALEGAPEWKQLSPEQQDAAMRDHFVEKINTGRRGGVVPQPPAAASAGSPEPAVPQVRPLNADWRGFPGKFPVVVNEDGTGSNVLLAHAPRGRFWYVFPTMIDGVKYASEDLALEEWIDRRGMTASDFPAFNTEAEARAFVVANHGKIAPDGRWITGK